MEIFRSQCDSSTESSDKSSSSSCSKDASQLDVQQIADELKEMTSQLDALELQLQTGVPACPGRNKGVPQELPPLPPDIGNQSLRDLHNNANKLGQQMNELADCSKLARQLMSDMEQSHCRLQQDLRTVRIQREAIESHRQQMDHQDALCQQRFRHVRDLSANWTENKESARQIRLQLDQYVERMSCKVNYKQQQRLVYQLLKQTHQLCVDATNPLLEQSQDMRLQVDRLLDSELWTTAVLASDEGRKQTAEELELQRLRLQRDGLPQRTRLPSFSSVWHDRMLFMIRHRSLAREIPRKRSV